MLEPGETFNRTYPARAGSVPRARHDLTEFAREAGAGDEGLERIRLAASEALTNAVLHAYEAPGGRISVSAACVQGELLVLVSDQGAGLRVRQSRGLGLGLALIAQVVDDFQILSRGTGGTELRMEFQLDPAADPGQLRRGSVSAAVTPA
jgi:anti-sigma regulatory factor (Ser/Thr protein kinase)